jgi:two-component system response regulator (stage 0 sporulation protein F)
VTKTRRILIADDDPRVLLILRATLERTKNSYEIVSAGDGTEALAKIENQPFDLVMADVRMPGIDGIELVEEMRALNLNTAVVWITAYGCHRLQKECDRLDICRCLDKPLRIGQIRQAAREALETTTDSQKTDD